MFTGSADRYPSEMECMRIIEEHDMFPNIIEHSIQVKNVSVAIYKNLVNSAGISLPLIIAASLLHDIAKTSSIKQNDLRHDLTGGKMLREMGFDEIAEIVENHVVFTGFNPDGPVTEKEIVFYADKRVMHDRIVTIDTRVEDLVQRYGATEKIKEIIRSNRIFVVALENKIESHMSISIDTALQGL